MFLTHTHNPEIDWKSGQVNFTHCPSICQGKCSLQSTLFTAINSASQITEYSHYFDTQAVNCLVHNINSKETTSMCWAIEALKKDVLTIKDILEGPFKEFADVFKEKNYQELPPHQLWDHKIKLIPEWESKIWKPHLFPLL